MTVHMFLKLDGVKGETLSADHPDEMEIESWNWSMSQSGNFHQGSGGGAGKVSVAGINIQKYVDTSTPVLQQFCCIGKHINSGLITCRKASGQKSIPYLQIHLKGILITSQTINGVGNMDQVSESIGLHFQEFKTVYLIQDSKGVPKNGPEHGYNIARAATV